MFKKLKPKLFKEKSEEELAKHYESLELEKGDLKAMIIAGFIVFMPLLLVLIGILILIAKLFGL